MSLKEKVENNVAIWLLGTLLTGFLAGIAAYKSILEISNQTVVSVSELMELRNNSTSRPDEVVNKVKEVILSSGHTVLIPGFNIGVKLDADDNLNQKTKAIKIWFAYPINELATITESNKSDTEVVAFVKYWIDPNKELPVSLGSLGTFQVKVFDHQFQPNHQSVQRATLQVSKNGS